MILEKSMIVTTQTLASTIGSGLVDVYSTPSMITFMEETSKELALPLLKEGEVTVGIEINIKHLRAVTLNEEVVCRAELKEQKGKILTFRTKVTHQGKVVGDGIIKRAIVHREKFMEQANS